jgi:hypothetical protein
MQTDLFTPPTGTEIGHAKAKQAAAHAGESWQKTAYDAFVAFAKTHSAFKTEDVRSANPDIPPPPDPRAWGAISLMAKRNDIVVGGKPVKAENPRVHGMYVTLWTSRIYQGPIQ